MFWRELDGKYRKTFNVGIGKNPLINGITSTETVCAIEFGENVITSTWKIREHNKINSVIFSIKFKHRYNTFSFIISIVLVLQVHSKAKLYTAVNISFCYLVFVIIVNYSQI